MSTFGRHVLVTGGAGFVGTNLAARLVEEGRRVLVLDNLARPGVEQNLLELESSSCGRVTSLVADVRDREAMREAVRRAEAVFHLAAQVAVTTSLDDPLDDFEVNLGGTITLLEEIRALGRHVPLLFTSTNKVYGALPDVVLERPGERWEPADPLIRRRGIDESRRLDFCTPYGCSKGGADQYVLDYAKTYDLPAVVFRMSCIYGPHQHGNEDQGWIAHFLIQALAERPVTIYGDGAQVRDALHASDLAEAMLRTHEDIERLAGQAFNVGGGPANTLSLLELVQMIEKLEDEPLSITFRAERPGDQRWYVSDTSRLREETGWQPLVGVEEGVASLHSWLADRRAPALAPARSR
jgi:CDP-paratose 2-epimerase